MFLKAVSGSALASIQIRIRIGHFWLIRIRIQAWKNNKFYRWKKIVILLIVKTCNAFFPRPPWRTWVLRHSKENSKHFKTIHFFTLFFNCGSLLSTWFRTRMRILDSDLDPDPADQNQCVSMRIRIHNTALKLPSNGFSCMFLQHGVPPAPQADVLNYWIHCRKDTTLQCWNF